MSKPLTSLSIRVNIPEEKEYQVKEEVVILWGRIWGAGIAVLISIAVIIGLWVVLIGDDAVTQPDQSFESRVADKVIVEVESEAGITPVKPVQVAAAKSLAAEVAVTINSTQAITANKVKSTSVIVPEIAPPAIIESEPEVAKVLAPNELIPAVVTTSSEHLLRAALTTEMKGRQPANDAPAVLHVPEGQLLTVYFFTELNGLRKQTVHYDWFRNERRVARVKIRPRFDTTGNFSSKYIDRNMRGQWRVVAKTASGELLATAQFEVR